MLGKLVLWVGDKLATYVLSQPEIARALGEALHGKEMRFVAAGGPIDFRVSGKRGQLRWAGAKAEQTFKAEKLAATDTGRVPGSNTTILMTMVGDRVVSVVPDNGGMLEGGIRTSRYSIETGGQNVLYPIVKAGQEIRYLIRFDEDCTWEAALYGAVPEKESTNKQIWTTEVAK